MTDIFSCQSCGLEQRYNAVLHKYDKVVKECAELKQSLAKVQSQRDEYIKEINQVITARLKATQDLSRMTEERNSAIQEYNLIMSERDTVHKEIEKLQEELSENQKKLTTLQEEKIVNIEQIDSLKREITTVLIDRDRLSKKIQEDRARYGDYEEDSVSPLRSPPSSVNNNTNSNSNNNTNHNHNHNNNSNNNNNNSHNQWDSSSSGISSSWKQTSLASIGSHGQSQLSSSRLDSMEQVNVEIEVRRQNERLQRELMYCHSEIEILKKERDAALEFKEKVALERESMRTLCDRLRKERDRVVCDLAEALRDSDDMRKQLNDSQKELSELQEKLESDKGCGNNIYQDQSCSSLSSTLSSPTHITDSQQQVPTSPTPTLLDRAYNKIYGVRRSRKTIDVTPEQEARETLASLDKVLADYSNQIKVAKKALEKSQKEKERNGGTWPKYRGPQILKLSEDEKLNGGPTMRSINRKGRKSLTVFNPVIKTNNDLTYNHLSKGESSVNEPKSGSTSSFNRLESNNFPIYDKINEQPPPTTSTINDYHSNSSRSTPSNSSTPIPISNNVLTPSEKISSTDLHPETSNCLHNYDSLRESINYRSRGKADSIDYSVVSAQIQSYRERKIGDSNYRRANNSTKLRPHSIHDVLSDAFSRTTLSLSNPLSSLSTSDNHSQQQQQQQQQQQSQSQQQQNHHHHQQQSSHDSYELALSKPSLPIPPTRSPGESIGLFRVAQPLNKRPSVFTNHVHPVSGSLPSSSYHNSPNSISSLTRSHHSPSLSINQTLPPRCSPNSPHSPIYNPHLSRTNDSGIILSEQNRLYDLPTTISTSGTTSTLTNSNNVNNNNHHYSNSIVRSMSSYQPSVAKLAVKDSHHENNRYSNASPTLSLGSDYPNLINIPRTSSSHHHHHPHHYGQASLHIPQTSIYTGVGMGYKSDENESDFVSSYDRLSTFPKRSARIRIPSNPSVTSTCSSGKLSTSSIEKVASSAHSDRGSPISFNVEWLSSGRRHRNANDLIPCPGDIRHIEINRSSGTLGINITSCSAGVFVTTVEKDSLANQSGIQIGDQILEICSINMRNAGYDHAANILRQCSERLNLLVQYNPNKMVANKQSTLSQVNHN
ncbi:disks large homolog 5-like [Panonychus citri]|uniref:disks large homolog 5-like n=1 Tax=Panonychus citri TaxID=50023 RepID=UPI0023071C59|nr:disks large homolog 5-like [Panonychus citri]XP_053208093.1 disks large homolog 5-like [Panonychus citri]XP_053208097.1 disks large homolog 5-like [Panonychus citri]XP_053208103.1 disks large homolog 5-like [Panonychus citri]